MSQTTLTERLARKGRWRMAQAKKKRRQKPPQLKTSIDLTFPERLKPLAAKFYQQALSHPAFVFMSPSEIRQSIENRLWSIAASYPQWFGCGSVAKREATPAQLAALETARHARTSEAHDRERRLNERIFNAARDAQETAGAASEGERVVCGSPKLSAPIPAETEAA